MLIRTSKLSGVALNWAAAKCEGLTDVTYCPDNEYMGFYDLDDVFTPWKPSTNWAQGGPIIERAELTIAKVGRSLDDSMAPHPDCWIAHKDGEYAKYAAHPLIAAMRCYVASKLGDTVEVPDELINN